jgi:hypothetical protein
LPVGEGLIRWRIARQANQILVSRRRVKPQNKKYFAFPEGKIKAY